MNYIDKARDMVQSRKDKVVRVPSRHMYGYVGMNSNAAKAMGFPWNYGKDTILIDQNIRGIQERKTELHELVERHYMKSGDPYWKAHKKATIAERTLTKVGHHNKK